MSQFTFGNIDETATDGFDLAAFLEEFESAVNSDHSGATAPVYAIQGMRWRDTSNTPHLIKVYDGAQWVTTGDLNPTTHVYRPWNNGSVLGALSGYGVGDGLEASSGNLRVKLDGTSLTRSSNGLKVNAKGIARSMIEDNTDGSLWTWDANGNVVNLDPGEAGQVLTAAGAGAPLYWADPAAQGMEFIGETSVGGVSSVTMTWDPTLYAGFTVLLNSISDYDGDQLMVRPRIGTSVVNWSDSRYMAPASSNSPAGMNVYSGGSQPYVQLANSSVAVICGRVDIPDQNIATAYRTMRASFCGAYTAVEYGIRDIWYSYNSGAAMTGINIATKFGTQFRPGGKVAVFGYRRA